MQYPQPIITEHTTPRWIHYVLSLFNDNEGVGETVAGTNSSAHSSFIRSDFVTIPVTSPFAVTRTAL